MIIRLYSLLTYNVIRFLLMKVRFGSRIYVHWFQRVSPLCALKSYGDGKLQMGKNCQFEAGCDLQVHGNGTLSIGRRVYMNRYCMVSVHGYVEIGDNCMFGPGVKVFDNNHKFERKLGVTSQLSVGTVRIGRNCWIGSNAIILKGANIGDNCVISAGCIVKGVIPPGSLVLSDCNNIIEPIRS